jgi:hypothetical protein
MKVQITDQDGRGSGIYDGKGEEIAGGTVIELAEPPKGWEGRYTVLSGGDADDKTAITNPAATAPVGPFEAKEKSPGWYAIYDGAGAEVGKAVRKDDADGFNDLSEDDKAAFAAEHAKA